MSIATDLTQSDLYEIGREAISAYLETPCGPNDATAVVAAGTAAVTRLHEIRERQRREAEPPQCTVPAVLAECDPDAVRDVVQGNGQSR